MKFLKFNFFYFMKTNKSFSSLILDVWAAVICTVAPSYCVKCLTLKTRKNATKYLPGREKELELICKLRLSDADIAARVWSHKTKLALINRECEALLGEVKTEEEFNAVIALGSTRSTVKVARVYTPSRAKMKELCASLALCTLKALAKEVPAAFDALTAAEVLGAKEDELIPATYERWGVATILAKAKPSWAPVFLKKLWEITPNQLGEEGQTLIELFFNIAFEAKEDMSELMPYFSIFQPMLYAKVRENLLTYEKVSPYFCVMFPQLLRYLRKAVYRSMYDIDLKGTLKGDEDVYVWLRIGYLRLSEPRVFSYFQRNMRQIKEHILPKLYNELFNQMVEKAPDYPALAMLYRIAENDGNVLETEIPRKLVAGMETKQAGATLRFVFPFKGWNEKLAARAVVAMVIKKELPVERLGELSETLQKIAKAELDVQSQLDVFRRGKDVDELVSTFTLLPKAEQFFLKQSLMEKQQVAYLSRVKISDEMFRWLLSSIDVSSPRKENIVFAYVQKWGLTEENYRLIQQSSLADKAPFWRKYVVK
ncbi:MAG: hypothetical protein NC218_12040 [Acetobacter sp.]|nr:hypothetical protein [Acetobacter sp.]